MPVRFAVVSFAPVRSASPSWRVGADEFLDAPAGLVFYPVADGHGGEHDAQVRFDRVRVWW
jgi:hypothetical protein